MLHNFSGSMVLVTIYPGPYHKKIRKAIVHKVSKYHLYAELFLELIFFVVGWCDEEFRKDERKYPKNTLLMFVAILFHCGIALGKIKIT